MISCFRYVPYAEVATYERQGWVVVAHLGPMHGAYAVLMRWTGDSEPEVMTKAAVEEGSRARARADELQCPGA